MILMGILDTIGSEIQQANAEGVAKERQAEAKAASLFAKNEAMTDSLRAAFLGTSVEADAKARQVGRSSSLDQAAASQDQPIF